MTNIRLIIDSHFLKLSICTSISISLLPNQQSRAIVEQCHESWATPQPFCSKPPIISIRNLSYKEDLLGKPPAHLGTAQDGPNI
jgi:hypothetical protein